MEKTLQRHKCKIESSLGIAPGCGVCEQVNTCDVSKTFKPVINVRSIIDNKHLPKCINDLILFTSPADSIGKPFKDRIDFLKDMDIWLNNLMQTNQITAFQIYPTINAVNMKIDLRVMIDGQNYNISYGVQERNGKCHLTTFDVDGKKSMSLS